MADSTIPAESVVLISNWPDGSIPSLMNAQPLGGFTGSDHHNVAVAKYPVGTMAKLVNRGETGTSVAGPSIMMYAKNSTTAIAAAYELCQPASATDIYEISSTVADAIIANDISPLMGVSISAMTASYYGWFWVGGVAPGDWITAMATGDLPTDDNVAVGLAACGAGAGAKGVLEPQTAGELDGPVAYCLTADA